MLQIFFFSDFSSKKKKIWAFFFLLESKTNYEAKFNFIGIKKKTEGVPKFFLKGRQIKNLKLSYIIFFFSSQGGPEPP